LYKLLNTKKTQYMYNIEELELWHPFPL
jgi:hypothetical protein